MQTSDQDLFERITSLGKVGVDQLVAYLGANEPGDDTDAETENDQSDEGFGSASLSS